MGLKVVIGTNLCPKPICSSCSPSARGTAANEVISRTSVADRSVRPESSKDAFVEADGVDSNESSVERRWRSKDSEGEELNIKKARRFKHRI